MWGFGQKSLSQLATCHIDLQTLFNHVVSHFDCVVIEGFRNEEKQNEAFKNGKSKLQWPNGSHNKNPSLAVDVAPYYPATTINWSDIKRFYYFAGFVLGIAEELKEQGKMTYRVRYGGDWNMDTHITDQTFNDLVHFELVI